MLYITKFTIEKYRYRKGKGSTTKEHVKMTNTMANTNELV